ncbi:MAG: anaerobic glycerol-3-phosphate dehydrogenase subunit C [Roseiflexus sp.]|nr:anaerobic glycerol-3-phosphate dehydrogenase subunit C [Roseiflexus sp.]
MTIIPVDHSEYSLEQSLDHCIKCNICTAACPVSAVTDLFPGPKYVGPQAQRFRHDRQPSPDESVDYCSGCRVCNEVCPTGVRIAELNARARARLVAERGIPLRNRLISRSGLIGRLGAGPQAPLANAALSFKPLRVIIERTLGIARAAPLPPFSRSTFRSWFRRRRTAQPVATKGQVVYFHGCAANYYEPWIGRAVVAVLEHNGFEVLLPDQRCCGLPLLSNGDFAAARHAHEANVAFLAPYALRNIPIVGASTSCTLTLKEEAPELLGMQSDTVRAVARQTYDIFEFLRMLHERGELRTDFRPIERTLPYHPPCQLRAHRIGRPALDVLELVPGLRLIETHASCCGIAGTYGLKVEKYQISMDVGAPLFDMVRRSGSTMALCDSETCRWQISHGAGVTARHPIEILAEAYGLVT